MSMKLLVGMAAIATGVGLSTLTSGAALVHADPPNPPPPCFNCQPGPGGPGSSPQDNPLPPGYPGILVPSRGIIFPPMGGSAHSGGRLVEQRAATGGAK
jgi:hypothetical protein